MIRGLPSSSPPARATSDSIPRNAVLFSGFEIESTLHPHPLLKNRITTSGWACDKALLPGGCLSGCTGYYQLEGKTRYTCQGCDFDLCEPCLVATKVKANRYAVPTCPTAQHPMKWSKYAEGPYRFGWVCNYCRRSAQGERWFCQICNDDLCFNCKDK